MLYPPYGIHIPHIGHAIGGRGAAGPRVFATAESESCSICMYMWAADHGLRGPRLVVEDAVVQSGASNDMPSAIAPINTSGRREKIDA